MQKKKINRKKLESVDYQKLLLSTLLSSPSFTLCETIVKASYFNPKLQQAVKFIKEYYATYSAVPNISQVKGETGVVLDNIKTTSADEDEWVMDRTEEFCKHYAIVRAIQDSMEDINKGDYGSVVDAVQKAGEVSLIRDLGLSYFDEYEDRIERMLNEPLTIPTKWSLIDEALYGGIARKELILFCGGSGVGKSFTLANLGMNFLDQKLKVLLISLELSRDRIAQRFDQMLTGINGGEWKFKTDIITNTIEAERGNKEHLQIVQLPAQSTANELRTYLKNFHSVHKWYPDLFIVDYLDEMLPNQHISIDNIAERDKFCTSQLRQIGVDYDMAVATASQLNREAVEAPVLNHAHIAGGLGKIRVSDVTIALRMDELQKARGIMEMIFLKVRNAEGISAPMYMDWNKKFVRISDNKKLKRNSNDKPLQLKTSVDDDDKIKPKDQTTVDVFDEMDELQRVSERLKTNL